MSEVEPIALRPRTAGWSQQTSLGPPGTHQGREPQSVTTFNRQELSAILAVYGRKVAAGEWRDYALDLGPEKAVFSVFRRSSECPLYRIEKCPKLAKRQGAYSVVAPAGLLLKRGPDLGRVLAVLEKVRAVDGV